jgi:hypothetical protein
MTGTEAAGRAADSLTSAEDAAGSGLTEQAQAWVAVADGWTRLAATIKQNLL